MGDNLKNQHQLVASPNYGKQSKWDKIRRRLRSTFVSKVANTPFQFKLYRSYLHYFLSTFSKKVKNKPLNKQHYLTQMPNYGAGIGHQMANWNSGLYFAKYFNIGFAHSPFSTQKWESFLGFGEGEVQSDFLIKNNEYKIVRLPRFDSTNLSEIDLIGRIISSYRQQKVLFFLEVDQGYKRQCDTYEILSQKFLNAEARRHDKLNFDNEAFNIAVHIRRRMKIETAEVWKTRGLDNAYFSTVLSSVLETINPGKRIDIYLFSQGSAADFPEFKMFENIHYCMDMGPIESVLHMVKADLLISSKSSFSYKPALMSKNIQIAPETFWHAYPDTEQYILADNNGKFDIDKLKNKFI